MKRSLHNLCKIIGAVLLGVVGGLMLIAIFERFGYPKWLKEQLE